MPKQTAKLIRRLGVVPASVVYPIQRGYSQLVALQNRQRSELLADFTEIRGFMPLLMKQRNGLHWTSQDRRLIRKQIRSLVHLSPYLLAFLLPGGLLLAWWLDRRRLMRHPDEKPGDIDQP